MVRLCKYSGSGDSYAVVAKGHGRGDRGAAASWGMGAGEKFGAVGVRREGRDIPTSVAKQ